MVRALDRHVIRMRAFNEAVNALDARGHLAAAGLVKAMFHAEIAAFDALRDKHQDGRPFAPVGS